jgi:RHS repeat-associated protein
VYDVANRVQTVNSTNAYAYDPANQRTYFRNSAGTETLYLYGLDGRKLATYTIAGITGTQVNFTFQSRNVYFAGNLISAEGNAVAVDRLGSVRWSASTAGHTYFPYGVEYSATTNNTEKYATYTSDTLTGLDYAMNRYYNSGWGRFMTPDPSYASIALTTLSWNRYIYALGDPANGSDPTGLDPNCGPNMVWDGEGCTDGVGSPLPDASVATPVNLYAVYNSQGQQVNTGSQLGSWSTDLTSVYNAYATLVDTLFMANATNLLPPNPACVQSAIAAAAQNFPGLDLSIFQNATVQIVNAQAPDGSTYSETELNLTNATPSQAQQFQGTLCGLGFYSNGQCPSNNTWLVGAPHPEPNGQPFPGNFRSPSLISSVQINLDTAQGIAQIDVDPFNPASTSPLGLLLHGLLQVLPNLIAGTDNGYGCGPG